MFIFLPLGGAGEIGASCFYLNIAGTGIILDCGMHPRKSGIHALPRFDLIKDLPVDFVLISHAHQDHLSALPFLVQKNPYIRIITTPQTRAIAELTLHDSVSIWKEQMNDEEIRIYSHEEIDLLIRSIEYKAYNQEFFISGYGSESSEPVKVVFFDAGHILGSAGILIEHDKQKIFYTGDINLSHQELMTGAVLPDLKVNSLIIETTYGNTDSSTLRTWEDETGLFIKEVNKILNNDGSVLIPVFSLGKTQEILALLWNQISKGKLLKTDIYTGGLGTRINRVYDYNRYTVNYSGKEIELASIPQKNVYEVENYNDFFKAPSIVLTSSGMMLERTLSFQLGKKWLSRKNSGIFTVGFMEQSTPGYRVAASKRGDKIKLTGYDDPAEVKCSVKNFRFSAHSKREELMYIIKTLNPDDIILVHGDSPAINWIGADILKHGKGKKVYAAAVGKEINIE